MKDIFSLIALLLAASLAVTVIRACANPHAVEMENLRIHQDAYQRKGGSWP